MLTLSIVVYLAYVIYPNTKNIQNEACVITGAINMLSSEGFKVSMDKINSTFLTQKKLYVCNNSFLRGANISIEENPFNISVKKLNESWKKDKLPENYLVWRKNGFYTTRNPEIEEEYNNIPSNENLLVWIGFEKPISFSEYEKVIYYMDNNPIFPVSTAFKSSDNSDDAAIHLRGMNKHSLTIGFTYDLNQTQVDYINNGLLSKDALEYFIKLCKQDTKYLEKLLNSELFKGVNIDFEKAYQYIKDNNYDVTGCYITGSKNSIDEKLESLSDSFVVDFVKLS